MFDTLAVNALGAAPTAVIVTVPDVAMYSWTSAAPLWPMPRTHTPQVA